MNRQYDGAGATMHRSSEVNYFPSTKVRMATGGEAACPHPKRSVAGVKMRTALPMENHFAQPGERWRSLDDARKERFVKRVAGTLNAPRVSKHLKTVWLGYWTQCDRELGARIAALVKMSNM